MTDKNNAFSSDLKKDPEKEKEGSPDPMFHSEEPPQRVNIKRDFLYGLIVILPILATVWIVKVTINLISGPINSLFGQKAPLLVSFLLTIAIILLVGIAARNIIGKAILTFIEKLFKRIPIINMIYRSTKQIVNAFSFSNKNLLSAVLVEYPRKGILALGFITKETVSGIQDKNGKEICEGKVALFMPTTPNPTSGYFIYVDRKEIIELSLSIEDSIKVLMSAGVVSPGSD